MTASWAWLDSINPAKVVFHPMNPAVGGIPASDSKYQHQDGRGGLFVDQAIEIIDLLPDDVFRRRATTRDQTPILVNV